MFGWTRCNWDSLVMLITPSTTNFLYPNIMNHFRPFYTNYFFEPQFVSIFEVLVSKQYVNSNFGNWGPDSRFVLNLNKWCEMPAPLLDSPNTHHIGPLFVHFKGTCLDLEVSTYHWFYMGFYTSYFRVGEFFMNSNHGGAICWNLVNRTEPKVVLTFDNYYY